MGYREIQIMEKDELEKLADEILEGAEVFLQLAGHDKLIKLNVNMNSIRPQIIEGLQDRFNRPF